MTIYDEVLLNGYSVIKNVIDAQQVSEINSLIELEMEHPQYASLLKKLTIPLSVSSNEPNYSILQLASVMGAMPVLRRNKLIVPIEECVSGVFNTPVRKTADSLIIKLASDNLGSPWHQDSAYDSPHPVELRQLSVWVPLKSDTPPLSYIKTTSPIRKLAHKSIQNIHYLDDEDLQTIIHEKVTPEFLPGDILVHHRNVIHRGEPNLTGRTQYVLTFNFEAVE
jgi:ectoine hydroxylase-related dioxygenase (phytanoyl-CoA dioxygenase family)